MYLHLGRDIVVPKSCVIGIFDLDNTTGSAITREFLSGAEQSGSVISVSDELPKSFVVCIDGGKSSVYLSQLAPSTLLKRYESDIITFSF